MTDTESAPTPPGVVVGVDGSTRDEDAVTLGTREAALRGWPLSLVHVEDAAAPALEAIAGLPPGEEVSALLRSAEGVARRTDASVAMTTSWHVGRPENVLRELSLSAGLVVVGTGRKVGAAQFLFGTVSLNVAAHAACPVLVVGEPPPKEPRGRVVVGVDGSRHSPSALRAGAEQARLRGSELVVHTSWLLEVVEGFVVTEPGSEHWLQVEAGHRAVQEELLAEAVGTERADLRVVHEVVHAPTVDALVAASQRADVLVVGNRGRGGFLGKLLGSVTMALLQRSHCPVLVTRAP